MTTSSYPTTDAQVFTEYFDFIKWHVVKAKIDNANVEDVAMNLLTRYIERGGVKEMFDPERNILFRTALSGFCRSYLYHIKEQEVIDEFRHGLSADYTVGDNDETPILDLKGYTAPDEFDRAEVNYALSRIRHNIMKHEDEKFLLFFDFVLLQVEEHGQMDVAEMAEMFGVTRSSIHNWRKRLHKYFEDAL